jgi:hypothetical protein
MSEMIQKDMSRYVAALSLNGKAGLGVVTTGHILTCAHYFQGVCVDRESWFEVSGSIPEQEPAEYYVQTLDPMLDFMVVGDNPLNIGTGDEAVVWEIMPDIKPVDLLFPAKFDCCRIPVYLFAPDGKTAVQADATLYKWCHVFKVHHAMEPICVGGPVFTADHELIGIVQRRHRDINGTPWIQALRIDMAATGWLRHEMGGFQPYQLAHGKNSR